MAKKRTKDQISMDFFGKKWDKTSIGESAYVNSEYNRPGSVPFGKNRKRK